jgi:hypothetical protein
MVALSMVMCAATLSLAFLPQPSRPKHDADRPRQQRDLKRAALLMMLGEGSELDFMDEAAVAALHEVIFIGRRANPFAPTAATFEHLLKAHLHRSHRLSAV